MNIEIRQHYKNHKFLGFPLKRRLSGQERALEPPPIVHFNGQPPMLQRLHENLPGSAEIWKKNVNVLDSL